MFADAELGYYKLVAIDSGARLFGFPIVDIAPD